MGLVKLDVVGLRMLATIREAEEAICRHEDAAFDADAIPKADEVTYQLMGNLVQSGETPRV